MYESKLILFILTFFYFFYFFAVETFWLVWLDSSHSLSFPSEALHSFQFQIERDHQYQPDFEPSLHLCFVFFLYHLNFMLVIVFNYLFSVNATRCLLLICRSVQT